MWPSLVVSLAVSTPLPPEPNYQFVEDTTRFVGIERGKALVIGKLDRGGNFTADPRWQGLTVGQPLSRVPPFQVLNFRRPGWIHVYEYRSGRLVKGELDDQGNFVPDLGSKVIDFKDYRYRSDGIMIYNLPGRFVQKK